jgi:hypothetical protein
MRNKLFKDLLEMEDCRMDLGFLFSNKFFNFLQEKKVRQICCQVLHKICKVNFYTV